MQSDGNLVIYRNQGIPTWWTGTSGSGAQRLAVQSDGNLVLYTAAGRPEWWSGTSGTPISLTLTNAGVLVLSGRAGPIWSS
jgi:hypothetical protein